MGRYQPWVVVYFRGDELGSCTAMAERERSNIKERQLAGIKRAKAEGRALRSGKTINDEDVALY